ncbi:g81 [Coccomyxa viridis]|uniref:G81 protein n=1 Tax=Coccomyxa viridis TaxID=1274662 RepID=A0ABP1FEV7_9CHLO
MQFGCNAAMRAGQLFRNPATTSRGLLLNSHVRCQSYQPVAMPSIPRGQDKKDLVKQLLEAKQASGKTYSEIANEVGLTNLYTAQLFQNQAELKKTTAPALQKAVPGLTDELISQMTVSPLRQFDPQLIQEPLVYRLYEAVMHYGESIKAIGNEEFGDGIMSAIDMFATIEDVEGKMGEKRLVLTLNGKWLPHIEQRAENNTAKPAK